MTQDDMIDLIEKTVASLPERMSGNEANAVVANELRPLVISDRSALLAVLGKYLSLRVNAAQRQPEDAVREARLWLALDVAESLGLTELKQDIASLTEAVRNGEVLLPVHETMVARYFRGSDG